MEMRSLSTRVSRGFCRNYIYCRFSIAYRQWLGHDVNIEGGWNLRQRSMITSRTFDQYAYMSTMFPQAGRPKSTLRNDKIDGNNKAQGKQSAEDILADLYDEKNDPEYPTEEEANAAILPKGMPMIFTRITCGTCETRSGHFISQPAYEEGTVVIACPGCDTRHIFVDNLEIFPEDMDNVPVKELMKLTGEATINDNRFFHRDNVMEFRPPGKMSVDEFQEYVFEKGLEEENIETKFFNYYHGLNKSGQKKVIKELRLMMEKENIPIDALEKEIEEAIEASTSNHADDVNEKREEYPDAFEAFLQNGSQSSFDFNDLMGKSPEELESIFGVDSIMYSHEADEEEEDREISVNKGSNEPKQ
ncbi:DNL zinc finger-domain-containing protein [Dipodascopsis uninucleata]